MDVIAVKKYGNILSIETIINFVVNKFRRYIFSNCIFMAMVMLKTNRLMDRWNVLGCERQPESNLVTRWK